MYCMHLKKYRVSSLCSLTVCICVRVCTLAFQVCVLKKKKQNNRIVCTLNLESQTWDSKLSLFSPLLVCTRRGQIAHLIGVAVPAGDAVAVNYNEYNQHECHIILHVLTKYQRKQKLFHVLEWASICASASQFWGWGWGLKVPNRVQITRCVELRRQQMERHLWEHKLDMKLALFWLFKVLPGVIDDFSSVLVVHGALVFLFFNKILNPGIAALLYQRRYVCKLIPSRQ